MLGIQHLESQLLLLVLPTQRASTGTWARSVGWAWSLKQEQALGQGLLDCLLVTWKGVAKKNDSLRRTFAEISARIRGTMREDWSPKERCANLHYRRFVRSGRD